MQLPSVLPAVSARSLAPNQAVGLIDDPEFLGYVNGRIVGKDGRPTGDYDIVVAKPGKSGLSGNRAIAGIRLASLPGARPNSAPKRVNRVPEAPRAGPIRKQSAAVATATLQSAGLPPSPSSSPTGSISHLRKGEEGPTQERRP